MGYKFNGGSSSSSFSSSLDRKFNISEYLYYLEGSTKDKEAVKELFKNSSKNKSDKQIKEVEA